MPFVSEQPIFHALAPHYASLRKIATRNALERSELWSSIRAEVERVTSAVERGDCSPADRDRSPVRIAAWNIQRGRHYDRLLERLRSDELADVDVLLLSEVDLGMGRSHNRNVARDLAEALGMSYTFGVSYLVLEDDLGENPDALPNELALAGCAILSRIPIGRVVNVDLPELRDKFSSSEKRIGKKRALVVELALPRPWTIACAHLDSNASSTGRAQQLDAILSAASAFGGRPFLLGGDLNTTTYDVSSSLALFRNLLHKLLTIGFAGAIDHYMHPELRYERPVFETLARAGLATDEFNDCSAGTMNFDMNDPYALEKTRRHVGATLTRLLVRALRPWNGCVPARLDWFAGRDLFPSRPRVVSARTSDGERASDHDPIVVDVVAI